MASDPPEQKILTLLSLVSRRIKVEAERRLMQHGVHAGQQFVLECLWGENGLTAGEIAQRIKVEAPTVTRAIQRMEASGLVVVGTDAADGRRIRVWTTPRADQLREVLPRVMDDLVADALRKLTGAERDQFIKMLGLIAEGLEGSAP